MKGILGRRLALLRNPEKGFAELRTVTLETAVAEHLKLLILVALIAALVQFLFFVGMSVYAQQAHGATVQYARMLNYAFGIAGGVGLFYMVGGSVLVLAASALLRVFVRSIKYTRMLTVLIYAVSPLVLFGWFVVFLPPLLIWAAFLFTTGVRVMQEAHPR